MKTNKYLDLWEKEQFRKTFKRCFGLQELVKQNHEDAIKELANQSGFRLSWIKEHIEEIKNITDEI